MSEISRSLILRYMPGQFSFSRLDRLASNEDLMDLADALNEFQDVPVDHVILQTRTRLFG